MAARGFTPIAEVEVPDGNVIEHPAATEHNLAADAVMLALKALSQRALTALASLFTLLTVGSAFWVWLSMPNPNTGQLVSLGMYGLFILAVNWIARRK